MTTLERVRTVISEQLGELYEDVKPESNLVDDLGANSLDQVEIVMELEARFGIDLPDEDAEKVKTVQDAATLVDCKLAGA